MTTMLSEECKCALCGAINQYNSLSSTNNFGGLDTEFRSYAMGADPLTAYLQTCAVCGYTSYDLGKNLTPKAMETVRAIVEKFYSVEKCNKKQMLPYKQYELAALIMKARRAAGENVAETFLRAAWMADDHEQSLLAKHYRKSAADILSKKLPEEKDLSTQAEQMFRLAEIYRRSGEFQLSLDTQEKIAADKLHPDLQLASIKLKQYIEEKKAQRLMFKEILG